MNSKRVQPKAPHFKYPRERAHITQSPFDQFWTPLRNQDNHGPHACMLIVIFVLVMDIKKSTFDTLKFVEPKTVHLGTIQKLRNPFLDPLDLPPTPCNPM